MNNLPHLADQQQRADALEPAASFIVQAPAGSGKTTLLTQRFLRLLSVTDVPEAIVAITFSRKAAEEMRSRVLGALESVEDSSNKGHSELDPVTRLWAEAAINRARKNAWDLRNNPSRLRILTIDALAHLIVRRHPIAAGGTSAQQVIEDATNLYSLAARRAIEEMSTGSTWSAAVSKIALYIDNNWSRLEGLLAEMLAIREQWLVPVTTKPTRRDLERALTVIAEQALDKAAKSADSIDQAVLLAICQFAALHAPPGTEISNLREIDQLPGAAIEDLEIWQALAQLCLTKEGRPRKKVTKNEGFPAGDAQSKLMKDQLIELLDGLSVDMPANDDNFLHHLKNVSRLPDAKLTDADWQNLEALFTVLKLAAAHLRLVFQQSGHIDFTEITLSTLVALGGEEAPSEASLLLDYQIDHLLIDEFQDTSIVQYQLIEKLTAGWTAGDGRSLFLVGDPMQSIYRFRQADVSRFTETFREQRFAQIPMTAVHLSANFRSDPAVVSWINATLEKIANTGEETRYPATTQLNAVRDSRPEAGVALHGLAPDVSVGARVVQMVRDAWRADPTQSIAILVRSRNHLADIPACLNAADIAIAATDIELLLEQPVVADLMALTRALAHPADRTAWLALLRAPWLALSLSDLSHLVRVAGDGLIGEAINNEAWLKKLATPSRHTMDAFNQVMAVAVALRGRLPLVEIVAQTWHALRGAEIALNDGVLHYAERYFRLLREFENRETMITEESLQRFLAKRFVSPVGTFDKAVHVMTIHKAKGLEFDTVILPGLNRPTRGDSKQLLRWQSTADDGVLMSLMPANGKADKLYQYLEQQNRSAAAAEQFRLLYVALTRAKYHLHLVCEVDADDPRARKGSMQHILWPAIAESFEANEEDYGAESSSSLDPEHQSSMLSLKRMSAEIIPGRMIIADDLKKVTAPVEVEYSWASSIAKYTGTAIHEILQTAGIEGLERFARRWRENGQALVKHQLTAVGIDRSMMTNVAEKVTQAINTVLHSERGQWIFASTHQQAHSELPLSAVFDNEVVNVILDRTFISEDGVRWIIDFKTGEHSGADLDSFLDTEVARYQPQLGRYAAIYHHIAPMKTRLALYFPLLDAWREWSYDA